MSDAGDRRSTRARARRGHPGDARRPPAGRPGPPSALQGVGAHFAGADPRHLLRLGDPDLSVTDLAGPRGLGDRVDDALRLVVLAEDLDLDLGDEIDLVLGAAVDLGVAALASEPLDVGRR